MRDTIMFVGYVALVLVGIVAVIGYRLWWSYSLPGWAKILFSAAWLAVGVLLFVRRRSGSDQTHN